MVLGVGDRPTSPDARAIPLPSPSLLDSSSRPASSESRLRRSARRYSSDFDDEGTRRALFDRAASPYDDTHHSGRAMERAGEDVFSRDGTQSRSRRDGGFAGPPPSSSNRARRVFSSASSSPAMSHRGHDSRRQSPSGAARAFDDDFASPAAKRGLGFVDSAGNWDSEANLRPARPSPRLVTLSERSDEGSGAASMSVSVSSQPSQSGRNSEDEGVDRDGDGYGERDDDGGSLRDFPLDELEPVNLDDVRAFRGGGRSAYSSYRSSPAATPRRGARRSRSHRAATRVEEDDRRRGEFERARRRGGWSANASPATSREGGRRRDVRARENDHEYGYGGVARYGRGSYSAAASPAVSRGASRGDGGLGARVRTFHGSRGDGSAVGTGGFAAAPRRRFESAPPSPSMGATRDVEFGVRGRGRRSGSAAGSRVAYRSRWDPPPPIEEAEPKLETAIDYLSMLTAALHFAAAAVAFAVLVVAVTANARSSGSLAARLDRIDLAMKGGVPTAAPGVFRGGARGYPRGGGIEQLSVAPSFRAPTPPTEL